MRPWPQNPLGMRNALALLRALGACLLLALAVPGVIAAAADAPTESSGAQVLQSFESTAPPPAPTDGTEQTRRWVMFGLGAPLLALILATAALGIAMGVYGKPVYLAHMICAGLSVTLAIVHAIVGIVWFRPF